MPQASDEQRARWPKWDQQAIAYLESQGWKHTDSFEWIPPPDVERALDAMDFLVNEFDWGGIKWSAGP